MTNEVNFLYWKLYKLEIILTRCIKIVANDSMASKNILLITP